MAPFGNKLQVNWGSGESVMTFANVKHALTKDACARFPANDVWATARTFQALSTATNYRDLAFAYASLFEATTTEELDALNEAAREAVTVLAPFAISANVVNKFMSLFE